MNRQSVRAVAWIFFRDPQNQTYSGQGYATSFPESYGCTLINAVQLNHTAGNDLSTDSISVVWDYDPENDTNESPTVLSRICFVFIRTDFMTIPSLVWTPF